MKSTTSRLALILACVTLFAATGMLATSQPEYCNTVHTPRRHVEAAKSRTSGTPTLAPRQSLVVLRVESDKPDIQVSWAEN